MKEIKQLTEEEFLEVVKYGVTYQSMVAKGKELGWIKEDALTQAKDYLKNYKDEILARSSIYISKPKYIEIIENLIRYCEEKCK